MNYQNQQLDGFLEDLQRTLERVASETTSISKDVARNLITRVKVESRYTPSYVLDDPFGPGPPNPYLDRFKPKVTLTVAGRPVVIEPYGPPGPTKWPEVKRNLTLGGVAAGLGLLAFAVWVIRK